jgi:hypothetical protein
MAAAATARKPAPARAARASATRTAPAPARRPTPARRPRPVRKPAPARRRAPARSPAGRVIPLAVGTASAVRRLPDSSLMVRMTRGRAWIAVLGVLLAGIVAMNVITLSFAATAGQIDQNIQVLDRENSVLRARDAQRSATARVRHDAAALGLSPAAVEDFGYVEASPGDVATAARRLSAAGSGY